MLDLETFATTPGAAIISIGAVIFDPVAGVVDDAMSDWHDPEKWSRRFESQVS